MARAKPTDENDAPMTEETASEPVTELVTVQVFSAPRLDDGRPALFLRGIPARDLTESDWVALTDAQRDRVTASGLYRTAEKASK